MPKTKKHTAAIQIKKTPVDALSPTDIAKCELPISSDGFPVRLVTSYDLEAVKEMVARLRCEIRK